MIRGLGGESLMNAVLIITVKMPKIDESKKMSSREQLRHRKKKISTEPE